VALRAKQCPIPPKQGWVVRKGKELANLSSSLGNRPKLVAGLYLTDHLALLGTQKDEKDRPYTSRSLLELLKESDWVVVTSECTLL